MSPSWMLLEVTAILVLALIGTELARRSRAAVRHLLLAAAFSVLLALPFVSIVAPTVRVEVPATVHAVLAQFDVDAMPLAAATNVGSEPTATRRTPVVSRSLPSLSTVLLAVWIVGAVVCLAPVVAALWQMRSLRRSGRRWRGIHRRVDVLLHESTAGPLTFGFVRPVILLPTDAGTWKAGDLRRAIIHELEHVRRGDWMTQCLARATCAIYWFHPLIWIGWRQFVLEAERACDDAVLRRSNATEYASQLVGIARRLSAARQPVLAMANRADLSARVAAVLDLDQSRGRAGGRWILGAAAAAIAMIAAVSPLRIVAAPQTPQSPAPLSARMRYDAATLKPCEAEAAPTGARGTFGGTNASVSPGRFTVPCVTAGQLIYLAYAAAGVDEKERLINDDPGTAASPRKVRGGPDWMHSLRDKYAVEATAPGATERTVLMGAMLRALLEERFQLELHRETEEVDMFALTVAKSGLKLKPLKEGDCAPDDGSPIEMNAPKPICGNLTMTTAEGRTRWVFGGTTFKNLAAMLSRPLGVHILDRTNISDQFIVRLDFQRDTAGVTTDTPSIATALEEQLGLKLERTRGPRGYLVIDRIQRPKVDSSTPPPARAQGAGRAPR